MGQTTKTYFLLFLENQHAPVSFSSWGIFASLSLNLSIFIPCTDMRGVSMLYPKMSYFCFNCRGTATSPGAFVHQEIRMNFSCFEGTHGEEAKTTLYVRLRCFFGLQFLFLFGASVRGCFLESGYGTWMSEALQCVCVCVMVDNRGRCTAVSNQEIKTTFQRE